MRVCPYSLPQLVLPFRMNRAGPDIKSHDPVLKKFGNIVEAIELFALFALNNFSFIPDLAMRGKWLSQIKLDVTLCIFNFHVPNSDV